MTDPYEAFKRRLSERHAYQVAIGVLVQTRNCSTDEAAEFLARTSAAAGVDPAQFSTLVIEIGSLGSVH